MLICKLNTFLELELKLGGSETKPAMVNTGTVVSGNNHKESMSVTPPLCHVPKPSDFLPVHEARLPAAESGSRKPPMPPKKDFTRDHQAVRQDGTDSRSYTDNVMSNPVIGHQHSVDDSKAKGHKTLVTEAKLLPPKPTVNPAALGAFAAGLRKAAEKDAPKPSLNDQQLSEMRSSLKKLPNPLAIEPGQTKPGDTSGTKYRTMPHGKSGTTIDTSEISSQGKFVPKKKALSASEAYEAELESNPVDSGSGQFKQLNPPMALNLGENKLESNRMLSRQHSGDAPISGSSAGPRKAPQGNTLPAIKPKPPITGPKPRPNTQTTITPL